MEAQNTPSSDAPVLESNCQTGSSTFDISELRRDVPSLSTGPNRTLAEYLAKNSPTFVRLEAVRKKGWENPERDRYWQNRREQSGTATEDAAQALQAFYDMTKQIAEEIQAKTSALTPGDLGIHVGRLGIQPGRDRLWHHSPSRNWRLQKIELLDLCSVTIVHRFTWMQSLKAHLAAVAIDMTDQAPDTDDQQVCKVHKFDRLSRRI
ncbi:hypothetical protein OIDMADRAFT_23861 [Oidiodendron maius Zn]|uniref:Uncharacterized protein n=1 Tax=Oidiodendron maius (strain Zn) TaxID=913774 RepID=A0A0C3I270_OIDMZ|nr:hypothetical protein OIDMADRAFT_23861 [Oidiodendron maius Zn]